MAKCYATGKTTQFGNNRSNSLRATRKKWKINAQKVRVKDENGKVRTITVSARALKKLKLERV